VAQASNRVIGNSNDLPWYLPADLKHFKDITTGHSVIMGRNTYESIFARLGKPLPNRRNIVITHDAEFAPDGVVVARSLEEALALADSEESLESCVIGGASIYEQMLPLTDKIYMTRVGADIDGDVYFPELVASGWRETACEHHYADEKNEYDYDFVELMRAEK
jgi:dihydrofolate reductase